MKFRGTKLSKRTLALLAAAVIMLGGSGITGAKAALTVIGPNYDATIATNGIDVAITEKIDGAKSATTIANTTEAKPGTLALTNDTTFAIGKTYKDEIAVMNTTEVPEYVRVVVRKYWYEKEKTAKTDGTLQLKPEWIELNVKEPSKWIVKTRSEDNKEYTVYYLKNPLGYKASEVLFDGFRVSHEVKTTGKKIMIGNQEFDSDQAARDNAHEGDTITYSYTYDGCTFNVEVEAQSVQTHNAADAMKSVWGVNATVSGDSITAVN
jgi:hypothetical protein